MTESLQHRYIQFQREYALRPLLNIGVSANPADFGGDGIFHLDLDRWRYRNFVQADAHYLPFRSRAFASVVCGDVFEHLVSPERALLEMARVAPRIVLTTFQEWRLPGPGQHIEAGQLVFAPTDDALAGYKQSGQFLEKYPESKISHVPHINQWSGERELLAMFTRHGLSVLVRETDIPAVHEGHEMLNYLYVLGT